MSSDVVIPVSVRGKYGAIDLSGTVVVPFIYDSLYQAGEGVLGYQEGGLDGFLDIRGNTLLPARFSNKRAAPCFSDGLAAVCENDLYGYIDVSGAWRIEPRWQTAWDFHEGKAIVESTDGYFIISKDGTVLVQLSAYDIKHEPCWPRNWRFIRCLQFDENRRLRICFYNDRNELTFPPLYDEMTQFHRGVAGFCVNQDDLFDGCGFGLVTIEGRIVKSPQFPSLNDFDEETSLALAWKTRKLHGYINIDGEWAIEPKFKSAGSFRCGLACVTVAKREGYIDRTGNLTIEPKYLKAYAFENGFALVEEAEGQSIINTKGDVIWRE